MKSSTTFSIEHAVKERLPDLRKKVVDVNLEIEEFIKKLMAKNGIEIKTKK
jgi:hypothetical protein